jgi:hypothetical protein
MITPRKLYEKYRDKELYKPKNKWLWDTFENCMPHREMLFINFIEFINEEIEKSSKTQAKS